MLVVIANHERRSASIVTQSATKALFTSYRANFPLTLCLSQMMFTASMCAFISGKRFDLEVFRSTVPLGFVNCANIVSGLFGTGTLRLACGKP